MVLRMNIEIPYGRTTKLAPIKIIAPADKSICGNFRALSLILSGVEVDTCRFIAGNFNTFVLKSTYPASQPANQLSLTHILSLSFLVFIISTNFRIQTHQFYEYAYSMLFRLIINSNVCHQSIFLFIR